MSQICIACGTKSPLKNPGWCAGCGLDNAWVDDVGIDPRKPHAAPTSGLVRADALDCRESPRLVSGTAFDAVLGGGIPRGAALLLWGRSGSGKTRLAIQLARKCGPIALVSLEMTDLEAARTIAAVNVEPSQVWVTRELDWRPAVAELRPRLAIVDSVSVWGHQVETEMRVIYEWAHATGITVVAICHATTAGKSKGGTGPVHWSDAALVVRARGQGRITLDTPTKNRFGATGPGRPVGRGTIA